jgi:hypothetical protein
MPINYRELLIKATIIRSTWDEEETNTPDENNIR